ncbi:segregation/condensation protein A [Metamycoplasma auris]|uniref:Segregation and condensation protein A n=1 Tax=Metamycoplasma auris TaxID=51363 RepID=A0A2W7GAH7_9BACT|nr:segregation/condensation protein A [Metamycoplasma auris]PZW00608.1 condensin subunit ScpA [Metamycoplasma auris]
MNNLENRDSDEFINSSNKHIFRLSNFDGPLDLLVTLVKEKNISIFEIDLIELVTQYLEIIKNIKPYEIDIASDYLIMAASLLQLKAKMLLQDGEDDEEVKQEKKRLIEQIAEYEKFKEISTILKEKEERRQNIFSKEPEEADQFKKEVDPSILDGYSSSSKLVITLRKMFERTYSEIIRNITISTISVSPEQQKERIINLFRNKDNVSFEQIFDVPSMGHFVITLLAILDLARQEILIIEQFEDEGAIRITKGDKYE